VAEFSAGHRIRPHEHSEVEMTQQEKVDYLIADLKKRGISAWILGPAPPLWRLAWRMGINLPPPQFMGFIPLVLIHGIPCGLAVCLALWRDYGVGFSASAGILFGLFMAGAYRSWGRKLKLPSWEEYPGV